MDWRHVIHILDEALRDKQCVIGLGAIDEVRASLNHALVDKFLEGLFHHRHANVVQELVPEAGIDEVTRGVLGSANIEVHLLPVFHSLLRKVGLVVVRIHITQIVSARAGKTRHGAEL